MTTYETNRREANAHWLNGWRIAGWGALLALLALPAIGMALTGEVDWTPGDFVAAAVLLGMFGIGGELAVRWGRNAPHRLALGIFALGIFLTLWSNLAVGIIGAESAPINGVFTILTLVAVLAALVVKLRARAMRWIAGVLALAPPVLGVAALSVMPGHAVEWGLLAAMSLAWALDSALFTVAGKRERA